MCITYLTYPLIHLLHSLMHLSNVKLNQNTVFTELITIDIIFGFPKLASDFEFSKLASDFEFLKLAADSEFPRFWIKLKYFLFKSSFPSITLIINVWNYLDSTCSIKFPLIFNFCVYGIKTKNWNRFHGFESIDRTKN